MAEKKFWEKLLWFSGKVGAAVAVVGTLIRVFLGNSLNQAVGLLPASNPVSMGTIIILFIYGFFGGMLVGFFWKHHMK